jgi:recombination protein RecA
MGGSTMSFDKLINDLNKKLGGELIRKGTDYVYVDKIPFSSPRANYMTYGGIPIGKATEFLGQESGGKTTSALDIVKNAQIKARKEFEQKSDELLSKMEELAQKDSASAKKEYAKLEEEYDLLQERGPRKVVYVDAENTLDTDWAKTNGVDTDELYLIRPEDETAEEVLQLMLDLIKSGEVLLIILDSIPMLVGQNLYEENLEKKAYGGIAATVTEFCRKVSPLISKNRTALLIINQVREDLANPYNQFNTPGGRALKHLYALRLFFRRGSFLDDKGNELPNKAENPSGNLVDMQIVKTKVCKPDRRIGYYTLNYTSGVDWLSDTIDLAVKYDFIQKSGAWFYLINKETGEILQGEDGIDLKFQGQAKLVSYLRENPELTAELKEAVEAEINGTRD